MIGQGTIDRLIAVGRPDLAERLKHLAGKHNQARHGWRFAKGGDDAARLGAARRSMRGRDAGERAEYRKRAGMPEVKPPERKPSPKRGSPLSAGKYHNAESGERKKGKFESELVQVEGDGNAIRKPNPPIAEWEANLGKNEEMAFAVDQVLGLDIVPETVYRPEEEASFQAFVSDAITGIDSPRSPAELWNSHMIGIGKMAMLDALIANGDRHGGNYLVKGDRIYAIDHGLSMRKGEGDWGFGEAKGHVQVASHIAERLVGFTEYLGVKKRAGHGLLPLPRTYRTRLEKAMRDGSLEAALSKTGAENRDVALSGARRAAQDLLDNWDSFFWEP